MLSAAKEVDSPIIVAVTSHIVFSRFGDFETFVACVLLNKRTLKIKSPVAIHLDHETDFARIIQAVNSGFNSVMLDLSQISIFEEKVSYLKKVVEFVKETKKEIFLEVEFEKFTGKDADYYYQEVTKSSGYSGFSKEKIANQSFREAEELSKLSDKFAFALNMNNIHGIYPRDWRV